MKTFLVRTLLLHLKLLHSGKSGQKVKPSTTLDVNFFNGLESIEFCIDPINFWGQWNSSFGVKRFLFVSLPIATKLQA